MAELRFSENTILISGDLKIDSIKSAWEKIRIYFQKNKYPIILIDLSEVRTIDSAGIAFLDEIKLSDTKHIQI